MNIIRRIVLVFGIVLSMGCSKDKGETPIVEVPEMYFFTDSFETTTNTVDELIVSDGSRWTNIQQVNPTNATNEISLVTTPVSEGQQALRFLANASDQVLSKMDIEKDGFKAYQGDTVTIKADFYINSTVSIEDLLLIDLECCSCWDPSVSDNQCPGVRLMMINNDYLAIERGKIDASTLTQASFQFPRNEWVTVQWELKLSNSITGTNRLLINGEEVINSFAMNLPNAKVFEELFAENGVDFTLQEPVFYERVQIGATANPTAENIELFVDNFSIRIE